MTTARQAFKRRTLIKAAAASAVLAACGPSGTSESTAGKTVAGGPAGELRVWISARRTRCCDARSEQYTADKPNVRITFGFPFAQYFQKITTAFAGGTPQTCFGSTSGPQFAAGVLLPLDKYVTKAYGRRLPAALKGEWQGALLRPPAELTNGLFVNKLFAEKGISVPHDVKDAWTGAQLRNHALTLVERSGGATTRWAFGSQRAPGDWTVLPYIGANDGTPLSPDLKKASGYLNAPASVEAIAFYGALHTKDKVASANLPPDAFPTGKVAIFDAVSTYVVPLKKFSSFEYDIAPAPKQKKQAVMTGGWNVGINSKVKDPALAWDLVDYMTRVKHGQWAMASGYLPCRRSVVAAEPMYRQYPWTLFIEELDKSGIHRPATPEYSFFSDTFGAAVVDVISGADVQQALDKAAVALDQRLAKT